MVGGNVIKRNYEEPTYCCRYGTRDRTVEQVACKKICNYNNCLEINSLIIAIYSLQCYVKPIWIVKVLKKQNTTNHGINLHFIKFEYHYILSKAVDAVSLDWELHITEDGMVEDVTGLLNKIFRSDMGSVLQTSMTPQSEFKSLRKV